MAILTPAMPQNFYTTQANGQVFLQWDAVPSAQAYNIQRSIDGGVSFFNYTATVLTKYLDSNVTQGVAYTYRLSAASDPIGSATATITFTGNPSVGDSFTIAGFTFTAVTGTPGPNQFNIGVNSGATIVNIFIAYSANSLANQVATITSAGSGLLVFTSVTPGIIGNVITFVDNLTNTTLSGFSGGTSNLGPNTAPQSVVPSLSGELSLGELRTRAQQRADKLNSNYVTLPEWNFFINQAMFELYDYLITLYEDYFVAPIPVQFTTNGQTFLYPLPNGVNTYTNGLTGQGTFTAPPFYKLIGVDLGLNTANNAFVSVKKFEFADRNKFLYPNSSSTIYGVFNLQYHLLGGNIQFIPTPSANQPIRLWYIPRMTELLQDTDLTTQGISGWLQYVIIRAAKYALDKEESDTMKLDEELGALKQRIEESAMNRDAGNPATISDVNMFGSGTLSGYTGFGRGGW